MSICTDVDLAWRLNLVEKKKHTPLIGFYFLFSVFDVQNETIDEHNPFQMYEAVFSSSWTPMTEMLLKLQIINNDSVVRQKEIVSKVKCRGCLT